MMERLNVSAKKRILMVASTVKMRGFSLRNTNVVTRYLFVSNAAASMERDALFIRWHVATVWAIPEESR